MRRIPIHCDYTEEELLKMSKNEAQKDLSEKQMRFCECYVEGHNRKMAVIKAGYSSTANNLPSSLLKLQKVRRYICWLKVRITNEHMITAMDVLDEWIRIAFSDITDFVEINPYNIKLKKNEEIDGQLVKSIKSGRDGVSIELYDKMRALDNLARYLEDLPLDFKQKIENRKVELMEQEFELKKKLYEREVPEMEDDGFIQAIKEGAEKIWENE